MTVGKICQKLDDSREREKRMVSSMQLGVSGESMQMGRKVLAQVLRGWSCKEGELGTKGIKAVGPSPRHEEYR